MRKVLTVILVLLNLVVFAVFYLFEHGAISDNPTADTGVIFDDGVAADIDYLRISGETMGPDRVLKRIENKWILTSPLEWPANHFAVNRILNQIKFLKAETSFSVEEIRAVGRDLDFYGLKNPQLKLEFGTGSNRTSLTIGASTEIGNRVYILSEDEEEIYVIERGLYDSLLVNLSNLRSQSVFDIQVFEVQTISIQKSYPTPLRIRIARNGDDWRFETPIQTRADRSEVETVVNGLNSLKVQNFITNPEPDLSVYGLANPTMRLTIEGHSQRQSILLGDKFDAGDEDYLYYAKGSENNTVFTIPVLLFEYKLNNAQEELRDRRFVQFDRDLLTSIEVTQTKRTVSLSKLESGEWQVRRREDDGRIMAHAADPKLIEQKIDAILALRALNFVSDAPSTAMLESYGFTDPQRIIHIKDGFDTKLTIGDFVPDNLSHVYAKLDSEPFIYEIDRALLDAFPVIPAHYRLRIMHEEPADAQLVGFTVIDLENNQVVYDAVLNEVTPTWASVALANESNFYSQEDLIYITEKASVIVAKEIYLETFSPVLDLAGNTIPWKYALDLLFEQVDSDDTWTTRLHITERLGGTRAFVGIETEGIVFEPLQGFINAFYGLTFSRYDPGPEPEDKPIAPAIEDPLPVDESPEIEQPVPLPSP